LGKVKLKTINPDLYKYLGLIAGDKKDKELLYNLN